MDDKTNSPSSPRPIAVLCFDGGGLRGLSSLFILKEMMDRLNSSHLRPAKAEGLPPGILKPCDIFDIIGGTSVGGIFAVLIGTLQMTVDEAIDSYRSHFMFKAPKRPRASTFFDKLKPFTKFHGAKTAIASETVPLFDEAAFKLHLIQIIRARQSGIKRDPSTCKTVITTSQTIVLANGDKMAQPHIFSDFGGAATLDIQKVVTACQATCALQGLLHPVRQKSAAEGIKEFSAVDSGRTNPTPEIIEEARRFTSGSKIGVVVSIGAGMPPSNPVERSIHQWSPVLDAMDKAYNSAELKAEKMSAEQTVLSWTNWYRFSIAESAARFSLDELAAYSQLRHLTEEFCTVNLDKIKGFVASIYKSRNYRERDRFFTDKGDNGIEVVSAVIHSELLSVQRLLQRCDKHYQGWSVMRHTPHTLLEAALDSEEDVKKLFGEGSHVLSEKVHVTEWVRRYIRRHPFFQRSWDLPTDPVKHSRVRYSLFPIQPTEKELIMALVPCHKSSLEHASYVLNNYFDRVFVSRERAEWIWGMAHGSDQQVRAGLWLTTVCEDNVQISSEVLHMIMARLDRQFPNGPWSPSNSAINPRTGKTKGARSKLTSFKAVPIRNEDETEKTYDLVGREYTRDEQVLSQTSELVMGLQHLDPLQNRATKAPANEYRYWPLPNGNFTRVIILRPFIFANDEALRCDIELVDLEVEIYTYDAVSYAWGEPSFVETLYCGTELQEIPITPTLAAALRSFRSRTTSRRLWVDAVCINQRDNEEKSHQVGAMAHIYTRARATLIYLGDPAPGQERHMFFLWKLWELAGNMADASFDVPRNNKLIKAAMMDIFGEEKLSAVEELTTLSWFSRRWIVQEAALCKVAVAFFGRAVCRIDQLQLSMTALANSSYNTHGAAQGAFSSLEVIYLTRKLPMPLSEHKSGYGILDLLIKAHFSKTSEPRDRLFTLLALAPDVNRVENAGACITLWPDYNKPLLEIYTDFTMSCLRSSPTLDILHCAGAFRQLPPMRKSNPYLMSDGPMGFPSFVPDWSAPRLYMPLMGVTRFKAGFVVGSLATWRLDGRALTLKGLVLDLVKIKGSSYVSALVPRAIPHILCTCYDAYERFLSRKIDTLSVESLNRTLIADHAFLHSSISPLLPKTGLEKSEEQLKKEHAQTQRTREAMSAGLVLLWREYRARGDGNMSFLSSQDRDNLLELHYADLVCKTMAGRSFIISEKGFLGITSGQVQTGDVIAILFGARTPFILRPQPLEGKAGYRIIGDCYIDGFMNGEALTGHGLEPKGFKIW